MGSALGRHRPAPDGPDRQGCVRPATPERVLRSMPPRDIVDITRCAPAVWANDPKLSEYCAAQRRAEIAPKLSVALYISGIGL